MVDAGELEPVPKSEEYVEVKATPLEPSTGAAFKPGQPQEPPLPGPEHPPAKQDVDMAGSSSITEQLRLNLTLLRHQQQRVLRR